MSAYAPGRQRNEHSLNFGNDPILSPTRTIATTMFFLSRRWIYVLNDVIRNSPSFLSSSSSSPSSRDSDCSSYVYPVCGGDACDTTKSMKHWIPSETETVSAFGDVLCRLFHVNETVKVNDVSLGCANENENEMCVFDENSLCGRVCAPDLAAADRPLDSHSVNSVRFRLSRADPDFSSDYACPSDPS
jgi:hypothetical protein